MDLGGGSLFDLQASLTLNTDKYTGAVTSAINEAQTLQDALSDLDADMSLNVDTSGIEDAKEDIEDLDELADDMDGDLSISDNAEDVQDNVDDIDASGLQGDLEIEDNTDDVGDNIEDLNEDADGLEGELEIEDNTDEVMDSVQELDDAADGLTGDLTITAEGAEGVSEAVEGINGASESAGSGIEALAGKITGVLAGAGVMSAISSVYNAIKGVVTEVIGRGDEINDESKKLGMTVQQYQEWDYIMQQCGADVGVMSRALNKFRGDTTTVEKAMETLGTALPENFENMDATERFEAVITALQQLDGEAQSTAAFEIFGNQWTQFAGLLDESPESIAQMKAFADQWAMTEEQVAESDGFGDAVNSMTTAFDGLKAQFVDESGIVPIMTNVVNSITDLVTKFSDETLVEQIGKVGTAFATTVGELNGQQLNAEAIISAMEKLGDPDTFTEEDAAMYQRLYDALCLINPNIAATYGTTASEVYGLTEELRENTQAFFENAKAQAMQEALKKRYELVVQAQEEAVQKQVDMVIAQEQASQAYDLMKEKSDAFYNSLSDEQKEAVQNMGAMTEEGLLDPAKMALLIPTMSPEQLQAMGMYDAAMGNYAIEAAEAADATEEFTKAQDEIADEEANYETWANAMAQIAGIELDDTTSAIDGVTDSTDSLADSTESVGDSAKTMAQQMTRSMSSMKSSVKNAVSNAIASLNSLSGKTVTVKTTVSGASSGTSGSSTGNKTTGFVDGEHATGLDYVPFDGYIAELHEGEAVLTKAQAQGLRTGGNVYALANAIANAVAARPMAFYVGTKQLATATADANSRANSVRVSQINAGRGVRT